MIPTLIVGGLVFGRWPRVTLVAAAVGWPVLLVATGVMGLELQLAEAAGLAVLNAGAGVLLHQGIRWAVGRLRRLRSPGRTGG